VYLTNSDDCTVYGAPNANQSTLDANAHAAAWGFTNVTLLPFSWPNVRQMRVTDYGNPARLTPSSGPYVGQTFATACNLLLDSLVEPQMVIQSTWTPASFSAIDLDNPGTDNFISVSGAAIMAWIGFLNPNAFATRTGSTKYFGGYATFATDAPPSTLANARLQNILPHGRIGCFDSQSTTIAEVQLAAGVGLPGESATAFCTRTAQAAMLESNYSKPHIFIPDAQFWSAPSLPFIPPAANLLGFNWALSNGINAINPAANWPNYSNEGARFLLAPIQNSAGDWLLGPAAGYYGPFTFTSDGSSSYALPGTIPPGIPFQLTVNGVSVVQIPPNSPGVDARWFIDGNTLSFSAAATPAAGASISVAQAITNFVSPVPVNAFAFVCGFGSPNGLPSNIFFQYDGNLNMQPGSYVLPWQSGSGYVVSRLISRGACAGVGCIGGPQASAFPAPQEVFRLLATTGASIAEAHVLAQAGTQAIAPYYWATRTQAMGEPCYRPYAIAPAPLVAQNAGIFRYGPTLVKLG